MKKLFYLISVFCVAFAMSTCEKNTGFTDPSADLNYSAVMEKSCQPETDAKCDYCSGETAWVAQGWYGYSDFGLYFNTFKNGNWGTYINYTGVYKDYQIYAGQFLHAGYAEFMPVSGGVEIYLTLYKDEWNWCFQSDEDEPVKILAWNSGYPEEMLVKNGNPKVGLFPYKPIPVDLSNGKYYVGTYPVKEYYAIHLDLGCCDD
ncbi:MAG: hypothetical protein JXJ22_16790 [Bacteroidales bacterium]|nr:hypothetical protein [Bacteroidales bacterium]